MSMDQKRALEIAEIHLQKMNPTRWDGTGARPSGFDNRIATYVVDQDMELDISFEKEDDGWTYYCELRDSGDETLLGLLHGKGGDINSSQSLAEIIVEVCS